MTAVQMRLPGTNPPQQLRPSAERGAPAFWVRRIRILSELKAGEEYVVRDVELRDRSIGDVTDTEIEHLD